MKVPQFNDSVTQAAALDALRQYRAHRSAYDERDWEIEKIYRQISKGKVVISVAAAIGAAGVDDAGMPRLAIARADCQLVRMNAMSGPARASYFDSSYNSHRWHIEVECQGLHGSGRALLPRIPPQHRPAADKLKEYWILWEADWEAIPRDPFLLKRIGTDAWVVLAAWDLTEIELSVLRAHPESQSRG